MYNVYKLYEQEEFTLADYKDIYKLWLDSPALDEAAKNELLSIKDDEKEIVD